ncbi:MAG: helix-turn-helix domain-containing protein [Janthinobacterium lividum]
MDKRRKPADKEALNQQRRDMFAAIERGEMSLQEAVRQMRALSRLTQPEFAAHRGVSVKVIKEIERGIGNPTVRSLNLIGKIFGLEVAFVRSAGIKTPIPDR